MKSPYSGGKVHMITRSNIKVQMKHTTKYKSPDEKQDRI